MPRIFALLVLAAFSASATPIAPLAPRIGPTLYQDAYPDAADSGSSTLVVWTTFSGALPLSGPIYGRIPGRQNAARLIGYGGGAARVAWNGTSFLVGYGIPGTRGRSDFPDAVFRIVHADGSLGQERRISTAPFGSDAYVNDLLWDGEHWRAGVSDATTSFVTLDRELDVVSRVELPNARHLTFTEIDGAAWAVQWLRDGTTETFALDDETSRFSVAGFARMAGRLAFVQHSGRIDIALFEPRSGFSAATASIDGAEMLDVHRSGDTARLAYRIGARVFVAEITRNGLIAQSTMVVESAQGVTAAVTDDEVFVSVPGDIRAYPSGEVVSLVDTAWQGNPLIVASGDHATAFWRETTDSGVATFTRSVDANGRPFGEVRQLPFDMSYDSDAAFDGQRVILVWASPEGSVFAWDGASVHALGSGHAVSIASSTRGTFIVWTGLDGNVRGTSFPATVPNGIAILPTLSLGQGDPEVTPFGENFMIVWTAETVTSVIVSPAGTVRSSTVFSTSPYSGVVVGGTLAAWPSTLFAFAPNGQPFELFDPHWGEGWVPLAIHDLGDQRHHVTITRGGALYSSVVTMHGAFITGITPLDFLGSYDWPSVSVIGGRTLVASGYGRVEVHAHGSPVAKRRAARR